MMGLRLISAARLKALRGPGESFSGAFKMVPNESLESSRWEFDLEDNVIIGGKPQRRRPSYCEVKCLRVAVGFNNVRIHIIGAPRYIHNIIQNRFLPSAQHSTNLDSDREHWHSAHRDQL